ncbi:hypothetical protein FN846DRAFT_589845 [Sphaerosporella brunnea]|uniref:Uncharacterized protein n=1 Tax=Sphaerosporella brunnea TaxID=1250544 RepID=A0A5J5ED41_9PEZI|nr:hypothetical protein FN846DRAFT_589845 [Sphaerosporella brunnea]
MHDRLSPRVCRATNTPPPPAAPQHQPARHTTVPDYITPHPPPPTDHHHHLHHHHKMRLPTTTTTALLLPLAYAATTCSPSTCTSPSVWCAPLARNALLSQFGCLANPGSTFLYNGGETTARHPNSACSATFGTPENWQIYVHCGDLKEKLDGVIDECIGKGSGAGLRLEGEGMGSDGKALREWGVDACGGKAGEVVFQRE